jgi:hypothetical protein
MIAAGAACFLSFSTLGCDFTHHQSPSNFELQNPAVLITQGFWASQASDRLHLGGETTGFGSLKRDGKVDFALVTPSLSRMDLLNFDLSTLISPESDPITVVGKQFDLPSNISLPDQTENYLFISIHLNKPGFRTFVKNPGSYTFSALRGQFPVKEVVDDFRNHKSIFDILNRFQFLGGGQIDADLTTSIDNQSISVDQFTFDQETEVTGPQVADGQLVFSLTLSDNQGKLSPVDLKRLIPGKTQKLKLASQGEAYLLSALTVKKSGEEMPDFSRLSLSLLPVGFSATPDFLPLTESPSYADEVLTLHPPQLTADQEPVAVYVTFSEIKPIGSGSVKTEEKNTLWESWTDGFSTELKVPALNYDKKPGYSYRFEVLYLVHDRRVAVTEGAEALDRVTHISRNLVEVE